MAVASSSDKAIIDIILEKSGLRKYFQYAVSSSEIGKSKPEPDVFLHAAKLLGLAPENCLVFEDSKAGLTAAYKAGIGKIIAVASTSEEREKAEKVSGVSEIINNFYDFDMNILKN